MISIDTDLLISTQAQYMFSKLVNNDAYQSIDEYSETQPVNKSDEKFFEKVGYNANQLVEDLKLADPRNRYKIIKMLKPSDMVALLPLLSKDNLVLGLKFFGKEQLLKYLNELPKIDLTMILKKMFTNEEIIQMMPMKALTELLGSEKVDKNQVMKYFMTLPEHELSKILESATGKPTGKMDHAQLLSEISNLKPEQFQEGMKTLPYKKMVDLVNNLVNNDERLLETISTVSLMRPFEISQKSEIIEGMAALDPDKLVGIVSELPEQLLAQVATMIDPTQFADVLLKYYPDVLSQIDA